MKRVLAVLVLSAAMLGVFSGTAHADVVYTCTFASDKPSYRGWASIAFRGCIAPGTPMTADCKAMNAWRWTASGWRSVSLNECSADERRVYAWPFGSGWTWVWSERNGWLAVRSNVVLISSGYGSSCPLCQ